jgi:hypothetical protein
MLGTWMSHRETPPPDVSTNADVAAPLPDVGENRDVSTLLDVAYPMQRVRIRWHTLNGGEVAVPGQVQTVAGQVVEVWFDRNAPSYNPLHADDQVWIDTLGDLQTYTMIVLVQGLPRKDQRRQYVRERVGLPPMPMVPVDEHGDPIGEVQEITITDLSGGGMRLELDKPLPPDHRIMVTFDLGLAPFDVIMTIVESVQTIKGRQIVRGYFSEIEERSRREIIRFVFREQIRKSRLAPP